MTRDSLRDRREGVPAPPTPGPARMLGRALRLRCCVCGAGGIFHRFTRQVERCGRCGFLFERWHGQFIGAVGVNTIVTFALLLATLVAGFALTAPDVATTGLVVAAVGVAVLFPVAFYPFSKTIWTAIDLILTPLEPGEAPRLPTMVP